MKFTSEQQLAIDKEGANIIVSAGAGSGKTAVLTERVIRKLKSGIDVSKLLVLTFTNEAANEMKNRIRESIIKNNLTKQLDLLDSAYITTFDSFALSLVKKYHYLLNVSKNIKIVDNSVITIKKYKILDRLFENRYGNDRFNKLINDFCNKDDISIKEFVIMLSNKLDLLVDKNKYMDEYINNYYSSDYISETIDDYVKLINSKIIELDDLYNKFTSFCTPQLINKLDNWLGYLFKHNSYDELVCFKNIPTVKFLGVSEEGLVLKDEIKNKIKEISELLRFDNINEIKEGILSTKDYIEEIIEIIILLDKDILIFKDKYQVYEFNDISHMAIEIVSKYSDICEEIKYYFNEIMIDEYQDTSNIQEEFISYIENNNVYMVGDIKQSIYRFRNANPYIFQKKYDEYQKGIDGFKIDLNKNFRSRSETINNINEIFNVIMDNEIGNANYIKEHNMVYNNYAYDLEDTKHNNYMEIYNYELSDDFTKEEQELFIISEDINEKVKNKYQVFDKKTGKLRDLKYADICIITDRNKYLTNYRKILEYHNIPSIIYMDEEITSDSVILVIKNLINLVALVNLDIYDDKFKYVFTSVARSFIFNYSDNMIYHLIHDKKITCDDIINLCKKIDINEPLPDIINNIINTFNIYDKLTNLTDINNNIVRISNLIDISNNLSDLNFDILEFIQYLDDTIEMGVSIKYSHGNTNSDAVKIMNIHKSKGLEFSLCYFTGMHNKFTIKDITSKNLFSEKYGIIMPYIYNDEICNTILRDLYTNDYYIEEVSEKIRLFYVALTRAREKIIIVTSLDKDIDMYNHLVPYEKRIRYRSFLDILNSIGVIRKYIINKEANYNHNYKKKLAKNITFNDSNIKITDKEIDTNYSKIEFKHYSKDKKEIFDIDSIKNIEYGKKIHEILEYADFYNTDNEYVHKLLSLVDNNFINVYHEYEFSYEEDSQIYNGVIDLMIEYTDKIYIIDYKLKNISDIEYKKQLRGYRNYIKGITDKKIKMFLYSIMDNKLVEVKNEK